MSCGVDRRHGWDPKLLWLWFRPAATAPIGSLAWETPCASGGALKNNTNQPTPPQKNHIELWLDVVLWYILLSCPNEPTLKRDSFLVGMWGARGGFLARERPYAAGAAK